LKVTEKELKQLIRETAREAAATTVSQLQAAGLLRDDTQTAYQKTEALLYQYPALKKVQTPYAQRVVQEVEACLAEAENEPYLDVIRLYYFGGNKNAACADIMCSNERTLRRARKKLVQQFSTRLASDDFIRELLG
jgi:hypothetical protein